MWLPAFRVSFAFTRSLLCCIRQDPQQKTDGPIQLGKFEVGLIPGVFTKGLDNEGKGQGVVQGLGAFLGGGLSSLGLKEGERGGSGYLS